MKVYLFAAVLALVASLAGFGVYQRGKALDLQAQLSVAESRIKAHEEAARVLSEHAKKVEADRKQLELALRELETKEGIDEELNPYLRAVLERLWQ